MLFLLCGAKSASAATHAASFMTSKNRSPSADGLGYGLGFHCSKKALMLSKLMWRASANWPWSWA